MRLYTINSVEGAVVVGPPPASHDIFVGHVFVHTSGETHTLAHTQRALDALRQRDGLWMLLPSELVRERRPYVPLFGVIGESALYSDEVR